MDSLTHALMGAQLAHLGTTRDPNLSPRARLLLGGFAAAFPDIDFIGFAIHPLRFLAHWHQAPTHSLVLLPVWAALLAAGWCGLTRRREAFREAVVVSGAGIASHIALDVITAYGTQVFYPLSDRRVTLGTTFVIDPLFTAILAIGVVASLRGRRRVGVGCLLMLGAYVGAQGLLRLQAERVAAAAVGSAPVTALPQPFSPFNWKLVITHADGHQVGHVNLAGHPALVPPLPGLQAWHAMAQAYAPPDRLVWQRRSRFGDEPSLRALTEPLWRRPDFADFQRFAVLPALSRVDETAGRRCVWFTDLRYDLPAWPDTFRYGFCQTPPGVPWRLFRLRYFSEDALQPLQ
jgi:inner membrane protein